jgi:benzylsuccinate CoA-transferase BbsF subunit
VKSAPLSGVRVIEHGQLLAVPYAARMLADLGAEVIKVESPVRLDSHRQTTYPDNEPGERYWDRGGTFYSENRGKLCMTLDLRHADSVEAFRDLVRVSDVVMENFTSHVMANFGLDYEALVKVKPDLIMLSSTGYGHTGPWANFRAVGPMTEGASGLAAVTGYDGMPPVMAEVPYTDYIAAEQSVFAITMALFRRKRTGMGCNLDLSQVEAQASILGELFLDAAAHGSQQGTRGNRHPSMAPHGFFPCAGVDRWIAIAVATDAEWQALRKLIGDPSWATDPRFDTLAGRLAGSQTIEENLSRWTGDQDAKHLMHRLQAAGISAGAAQDARDLVFDEQMWARGFFEWSEHPPGTGIEAKPYPGAPWRFSRSPRGVTRRGAGLGEHNRYVLCELLGYSAAKVDAMEQSGALGGAPDSFARPKPLSYEEQLEQKRVIEIDADYREKLEGLPRQSVETSAAKQEASRLDSR